MYNVKIYFSEVKGFKSEKDLSQYYFKNPNGTVLAVLFRGNNSKKLDYVIRYHDEYDYTYDFLKTSQLYSKKMFEYSPGKSKLQNYFLNLILS